MQHGRTIYIISRLWIFIQIHIFENIVLRIRTILRFEISYKCIKICSLIISINANTINDSDTVSWDWTCKK